MYIATAHTTHPHLVEIVTQPKKIAKDGRGTYVVRITWNMCPSNVTVYDQWDCLAVGPTRLAQDIADSIQ
jgi:hypothetical protein